MEITHQNNLNFKIKGKNAQVILDTARMTVDDFEISGPGEYEVKGVTVLAIKDDAKLVFRVKIDNVIFLYPGCLKEEIDGVDVLFTDNSEIVSKIEPKMVIPMGEEEQVKKIIKDLGKEGLSKLPKLLTSADKLPDLLEVIWL